VVATLPVDPVDIIGNVRGSGVIVIS
jgi:hypothetical protein